MSRRVHPAQSISLAALLVLGLCAGVGAAAASPQASASAQTWSHPPPEGVSTLVGVGNAICKPKACRYRVTCVAGSGQGGCLFRLALTGRAGQLITRPTIQIQDKSGEPVYPWPVANSESLGPGESRNLALRTIPPGKKEIQSQLRRGQRKVKGARWEALRFDILPPASDPFNPVFQYGDGVTIRLKG
jgi:hypothetical protein